MADKQALFEIVNEALGKELECQVCLQICVDAVACQEEGHLFCANCAATCQVLDKGCGRCGVQGMNNRALSTIPDPRARREIRSMDVRCKDCDTKTTLAKFDQHIGACPAKNKPCGVPGCDFKGSNDQLQIHMDKAKDAHLSIYARYVEHVQKQATKVLSFLAAPGSGSKGSSKGSSTGGSKGKKRKNEDVDDAASLDGKEAKRKKGELTNKHTSFGVDLKVDEMQLGIVAHAAAGKTKTPRDFYFEDRSKDAEFRGISVKNRRQVLKDRWEAMSMEQKKPYFERQEERILRNRSDQLRILGFQEEGKIVQVLKNHKQDVRQAAIHMFLDELRQGPSKNVPMSDSNKIHSHNNSNNNNNNGEEDFAGFDYVVDGYMPLD